MERMTGTPIEKWSDTPIPVDETPKVEVDVMAKEMDPFTIGNVRRGLEDQIEQNDNMLNGIIDNLEPENNEQPSKTLAELEAELETLKVEMWQVSIEMDEYMLRNGGACDYTDGMEDCLHDMREIRDDLEAWIAALKEKESRPEKKESLLGQLREFKSEVSTQPHHIREREMERCL